jgi:hypothetical protein
MESGRTWIVRVRMSQPQAIPEVADSGPEVFTDDDDEHLSRRLRDDAPLDWPRRLASASLEDGAMMAYFQTSTEPSPEECQQLYRLTAAVLPVFRHPRRFICEKTYPGTRTEISG